MKITYYGHACFAVEAAGKALLFDPFISSNPLAAHVDLASIRADFILVSHGHGDHIGDVAALAKRTGATVIAPFEVGEWLEGKQGVANVMSMNHGGAAATGFGRVKLTAAVHSSSLPDGTYGGNPCGFLCETGEGAFYYSGDTALTLDMQLVGEAGLQLAFAAMPIGDFFTMGIDDALKACRLVGTRKLLGLHYNTFPPITIDTKAAREKAAAAGVELLLPAIGSSVDV